MEINYSDWAYDSVDELCYSFSEVCGWNSIKLPNKKIIDKLDDYQNQWLEKLTQFMCVAYSSSHWTNIENYIEWSTSFLYGKDLWNKMVELWKLDINAWAFIIDWPDTLKDLNFISWYAIINTLDEVKKSITLNQPVITWSKNIDWRKMTWSIALRWASYWHAFCIIWYDDEFEHLIVKNSYWNKTYDKWRFYINYEDFDLLFYSKFSIIDKKDNSILKYKNKLMENITIDSAKKALENKIWNWERASETVTREECAAMIQRLYDKIK
jgi:hypothetical protein